MGKEVQVFAGSGTRGWKALVMSAEKETSGEGRQKSMRRRAGERAGAEENGAEGKWTRCAGKRQGAGCKLCAQDGRESSPELRERERERKRVVPVCVHTRFLLFHPPLSFLPPYESAERIGRRVMEDNVVLFRRNRA